MNVAIIAVTGISSSSSGGPEGSVRLQALMMRGQASKSVLTCGIVDHGVTPRPVEGAA
jgi:hypothetical protein